MPGPGADLAPVIAVVGPSGVGKDTVMAALCAAQPGLEPVRRVITRPAEAGGEPFVAATGQAFQQMQAQGDFVLSWQAHGLSYGIPRSISEQRKRAMGVLVNLSRSVLVEAQAQFGDLIVLSLTATPDTLATRLRARGRETAADQVNRLHRAALPLPEGLHRVVEVDNSGALDATVQTALSLLWPESV